MTRLTGKTKAKRKSVATERQESLSEIPPLTKRHPSHGFLRANSRRSLHGDSELPDVDPAGEKRLLEAWCRLVNQSKDIVLRPGNSSVSRGAMADMLKGYNDAVVDLVTKSFQEADQTKSQALGPYEAVGFLISLRNGVGSTISKRDCYREVMRAFDIYDPSCTRRLTAAQVAQWMQDPPYDQLFSSWNMSRKSLPRLSSTVSSASIVSRISVIAKNSIIKHREPEQGPMREQLEGMWWTDQDVLVEVSGSEVLYADGRGRCRLVALPNGCALQGVKAVHLNDAGVGWADGSLWRKHLYAPSESVTLMVGGTTCDVKRMKTVDIDLCREELGRVGRATKDETKILSLAPLPSTAFTHRVVATLQSMQRQPFQPGTAAPRDEPRAPRVVLPDPVIARLALCTRWEGLGLSCLFTRHELRAFGLQLLRLSRDKEGTVLTELADNLVTHPDVPDLYLALHAIADQRGTAGKPLMMYAVATLYPLEGHEVDRLLGFPDVPDPMSPEYDFKEYKAKTEGKRNVCIAAEISSATRAAVSGRTAKVQKEGWARLRKWAHLASYLVALSDSTEDMRPVPREQKKLTSFLEARLPANNEPLSSRSNTSEVSSRSDPFHRGGGPVARESALIRCVHSVPDDVLRQLRLLEIDAFVAWPAAAVVQTTEPPPSITESDSSHNIVFRLLGVHHTIPSLASASEAILPPLSMFRVRDIIKRPYGIEVLLKYTVALPLIDHSLAQSKLAILQAANHTDQTLRNIVAAMQRDVVCVTVAYTGYNGNTKTTHLLDAARETPPSKALFDGRIISARVNRDSALSLRIQLASKFLDDAAPFAAAATGPVWQATEGGIAYELIRQAERIGGVVPVRRPFGKFISVVAEGLLSEATTRIKEVERLAKLLSQKGGPGMTAVETFSFFYIGLVRASSGQASGLKYEEHLAQLTEIQQGLEEGDYCMALTFFTDWRDLKVPPESWVESVTCLATNVQEALPHRSGPYAVHDEAMTALHQCAKKKTLHGALKVLLDWDVFDLDDLFQDSGHQTSWAVSHNTCCERVLKAIIHTEDFSQLSKILSVATPLEQFTTAEQQLRTVPKKYYHPFNKHRRQAGRKLFNVLARILRTHPVPNTPSWAATLALLRAVREISPIMHLTDDERDDLYELAHTAAQGKAVHHLRMLLEATPLLEKVALFPVAYTVALNPSHLTYATGEGIEALQDMESAPFDPPLVTACSTSRVHLASLLLDNGFDLTEEVHLAPLLAAATNPAFNHGEGVAVFQRLATQGPLSTRTKERALVLATRTGHPGMARVLLDIGVDPMAQDDEGTSALHHAAGHAGFDNSASAQVLKRLASKSRAARDRGGETPLHRSVRSGRLITTEVLLEAGCDASAKAKESNHSRTPLHYAMLNSAFATPKGLELVKQMAIPAALTATDTMNSYTPLHLAAMEGKKDLIEILLAAGASTAAKDAEGYTPFDLAKRLKKASEIVNLLAHQP